MTDTAEVYAKSLINLGIDDDKINRLKSFFYNSSSLYSCFESPVISKSEKFELIDKIFDKPVSSFIKELCENGRISLIFDIIECLENLSLEKSGTIKATIKYAFEPDNNQLEKIKSFILKNTGCKNVLIKKVCDKTLIGGCIIEFNGTVYDSSIKGYIKKLKYKLTRR